MKRSRGFTLAEMSVCISVGSVLMGLALGLLHRTMRIESSTRSVAQVEQTATLLSRQFRFDVHRARRFTLEDLESATPTLRLELDVEAPVIYRLEQHLAYREQQTTAEQVRSRETFAFPGDCLLKFAELDDPPRVVLSLEQDPKLVGVAPQTRLHVEAVVGRLPPPSSTEENTE